MNMNKRSFVKAITAIVDVICEKAVIAAASLPDSNNYSLAFAKKGEYLNARAKEARLHRC
jgi:hypothetical protein